KGLDAALARYPWLDGERACALGASYGGFMMNWIEGNWPERFRCIVNHDGVFDQRMMYYSTEEIWFPEWEFGGPYYQNPEGYERWNPVDLATKWRTPMLVIHGEQDVPIPYSQGIGSPARRGSPAWACATWRRNPPGSSARSLPGSGSTGRRTPTPGTRSPRSSSTSCAGRIPRRG